MNVRAGADQLVCQLHMSIVNPAIG